MSEALLEMERLAEIARPSADSLRALLTQHLGAAAEALNGLIAHGTPGAAQWQRKLDGLIREISGGGRRVYGAARGQLEPIGPVVELNEWCEEMMSKIIAFRDDYIKSARELPAEFPMHRMAADWQQELAVFVPPKSEATIPGSPPDEE